MHPVERLRSVARVSGADPALVAREAAYALAEVARDDPPGLVPACRRLIEHHLSTGPLWWLAARVLSDGEPVAAARRAAAELDEDPTGSRLAELLPDELSVLVIGWPDLTAQALRRRSDLEALIVEGGGEGPMLVRRLRDAGGDAVSVPDAGIAAAAVVAGTVVLEALVGGPSGILARAGSHAAAAVASRSGVPVWAVAGVGRVLPATMWEALRGRMDDEGEEPWEREVELVPVDLLTSVVGPDGAGDPATVLCDPSCPIAPELLRRAV